MNGQVLIFGSYVTDLSARTQGFPRPGETIRGSAFKLGPGGKGSNQAVAAKRAGADVTFVTKLGSDALGEQALSFYTKEGMDTSHILVDKDGGTGAALIIVDDETSQNEIVVVSGACGCITHSETQDLLPLVTSADLLLTQLETNMEPVHTLVKHARASGVRVVLNPAPANQLDEALLRCVEIITPNESEAEFLTGIAVVGEPSARLAAQKLHSSGVDKVVITMGGLGCFASDGTQEQMLPIVDCGAPVDTTGAGDAFSGGLVAALARGMDFFEAVAYGSCTAGLAVTRFGTAPAMPYRDEIDHVFKRLQ